jgi:hypothetical protein
VAVVDGVVGCWLPGLEQPPMARAASTRTAIRTAAAARCLSSFEVMLYSHILESWWRSRSDRR